MFAMYQTKCIFFYLMDALVSFKQYNLWKHRQTPGGPVQNYFADHGSL